MPGDGLQRLARALELLRQHRSDGSRSDGELLGDHPELHELLAPLLAAPPARGDAGPGARSAALRDGPPEPGVLGDFRLVRPLGHGGMGEVYEAIQRSLGRRVALKILPAHRAGAPAALARFRREAELLASLRHEHIVAVHASGEAHGRHFFAMELIDGATLAQVVDQLKAGGTTAGRCDGSSLANALRAVLGDPAAGERLVARDHVTAVAGCLAIVARALAHVHAHGIVHRDVKPSNILLRADGLPLLTDFGLARSDDGPGMTRTGDFAGTPHYVAPEQIAGGAKDADERTDVFALGVTLYELVTLQRPFEATTTEAVLQRVLRSAPPDPKRCGAAVPSDLRAMLDRALQKDPADRYPDMATFAADLRAVRDGRPVGVRRPASWTRVRRWARREPLRAAFAAVVVLALALLGYLASQQPRIRAAAALEQEARLEELLEGGYVELGDGNPHVAVRRFAAAAEIAPERPEVLVGMVLAFDRLGRRDAGRVVRERLGASHPHLKAELADLATDQQATVSSRRAVEPKSGPPPADALGWYVRGMRWLEYGHGCGSPDAYRRAASSLRECIDRAPVARALYHCQYLHALAHLHDAQPIRAWCAVVEHLWPSAPVATFWRGFALEESDRERAAALLQQVVAARADLTLAQSALARTHEAVGRWDRARELYDGVLRQQPDDPVALGGAARALVHLGDAVAGLQLADRMLQVVPDSSLAHATRAAALLELGRHDEGLAAVDRSLALVATDPEAWLLRCRLLHALARLPDAVAAAANAARLMPSSPEPHLVVAAVHESAGDVAAAIEALRRVVALDPQRAAAWSRLGTHALLLPDVDLAYEALERWLALQPDDAAAHVQLGLWHKRYGDRSTAATLLHRALELDPARDAARVNLAAVAWDDGDREGSLAGYRDAAARAPGLESASDGFAWVAAQLGRHDDAIAERRRWATLHRDSPVAWLKLCKACVDAPGDGALELAQQAVDHAAAAVGGPRADVLFWRATVAQRRGDPEAAVRGGYEAALAAPHCSADLAAVIRRRLADLR